MVRLGTWSGCGPLTWSHHPVPGAEAALGTDPRRRDTDGDGRWDPHDNVKRALLSKWGARFDGRYSYNPPPLDFEMDCFAAVDVNGVVDSIPVGRPERAPARIQRRATGRASPTASSTTTADRAAARDE